LSIIKITPGAIGGREGYWDKDWPIGGFGDLEIWRFGDLKI
jgi:hypothetical protein